MASPYAKARFRIYLDLKEPAFLRFLLCSLYISPQKGGLFGVKVGSSISGFRALDFRVLGLKVSEFRVER